MESDKRAPLCSAVLDFKKLHDARFIAHQQVVGLA
jgi:hypothetical protein